MDDRKSTQRLSAMQGAPRVHRRRNGSWIVAYDGDGVTHIGKLTAVPARTDLDRLEDALQAARNDLEAAVSGLAPASSPDEAGDALALAFARCDFEIFLALEALKEALMS